MWRGPYTPSPFLTTSRDTHVGVLNSNADDYKNTDTLREELAFVPFLPVKPAESFACGHMAATAKSLQSCLILCDPVEGSSPGPFVLGFSRQEHWKGLPFPSPVHESEKSKWSPSVVSDPQRPHGLQPTRLLRPWDFPGKSTGVGCQIQTMCVGIKWEMTLRNN